MVSKVRVQTLMLVNVMAMTVGALAADTGIDVGKSTMVVTFKQEGVAVTAPFKRFTGHIVYSPANIAATSAVLEVETASLDLGDEAYSEELRKKAWFDSATYPKAGFRSTAIKADTEGHFDATGALTIKGRVLSVTVPVTVKKSGAVNAFDGSIVISRKAFGVGDPTWNELLDDKVTVQFHLVN